MDNHDPVPRLDAEDGADADLARRLARYRSRVQKEGRARSLRLIDQAIEDAATKAKAPK